MPDEWNYPLLVTLFDELLGQDLQGEEGKHIDVADLEKVLRTYGRSNFQRTDIHGDPILPRLVKILKDKGHTVGHPVEEGMEELNEGEFCPKCLAEYIISHWNLLQEAEYKGRKVPLGKPMRGDVKKFKVYVKNKEGNVIKVNFGDPNMKIKKSNPKRRKSFRARHKCHTAKDRTTPRYWSCRAW